MHQLSQSLLGYIHKHDLLRAGDRVGVAVSGGADSVALLRVLLELRRELGIVVCVVHLNHTLRGAESDADEHFVREVAGTHNLQYISENADVKRHAAQRKLSLETAARDLRYQFFQAALAMGNLDKIATAHTLDDQAETVLSKLTRGAGTRGLAGIYPKLGSQQSKSTPPSSVRKAIVRPMLATRRCELEAYLREMGQNWREDSSNRELKHTRNRLRHDVLPRLEREVNPRVRETLAEAADIARAEEEFWSETIGSLLPRVWKAHAKGGSFKYRAIEKLPLAMQRRLIRAAGECLGLTFNFRHVEEVLNLHAEGDRAALPKQWEGVWHKGEITFTPPGDTAADYQYELPVPGRIEVPEAQLVIEAVAVSKNDAACFPDGCYLEVDLTESLILRNWRPGDRFCPAHAREPGKIKELLQERHISGEEKKLWPVLVHGDQIVWVRGLGPAQYSRQKGKQGLLIRDSPLERL